MPFFKNGGKKPTAHNNKSQVAAEALPHGPAR